MGFASGQACCTPCAMFHHLRELKALVEIEKEDWARKMQRLLRRASHAANLARTGRSFEAPTGHSTIAWYQTWCGKRRPKVDLPARSPRSRTGAGPTGIGLHAKSTPGCLR